MSASRRAFTVGVAIAFSEAIAFSAVGLLREADPDVEDDDREDDQRPT